MPMSEEYVKNHRISYILIMHSDLPALADMLIVLGMLIKNDILGKLILYCIFLFLCLGIFVFARKYSNEKIAYLSVLIFVSIPLIIYYAGTAHTDISLALFTILSFFAFLDL